MLFLSINTSAQIKWDGEAGDGQWTSATNWVGNIIPVPTDDVVLDNSMVAGDYTVNLPALSAVKIKTLTISPISASTIQLILPASNTTTPAFTATGPGYAITINNGGLFINSSGASSNAGISIGDSLRINNGGQYTHNTRSSHMAIVAVLSKAAGTEKGIFKFDVPGGGYTLSLTNRTYGTLVLNADASSGTQSYTATGASLLIINGDFILQSGVTLSLNFSAATTIMGNYKQEGGVFNLASAAKNNAINIRGDFIQSAGSITETSTGLPAIELNGSSNQNILMNGTITNSIDFRINNSAGFSLLSDVSLPYNLDLINGIVHSNSFLTILQAGCTVQANPASNNSFVNGPLRKEGLTASSQFLFPVGKDNVQRWITLQHVTGNYTVEFLKANPKLLSSVVGANIHHVSSIEYWSVKADAAPVPAAGIELSFDNVNSGGVTDLTKLRVAQLVAGVWTDEGNASTTGSAGASGSVLSNTINMFDAGSTLFTLASTDPFQNPLPLKLISCNSDEGNGAINLHWEIASSWQPAYFQLQSSGDGEYFTTFSKIDTSSGQTAYQYADKRQLSGKQYFRLKAIESDSTILYSQTIIVKEKENTIAAVQLWPSVVSNNANLIINAASNGNASIKIYNAEGKLVEIRNAFLYKGDNNIGLQLQRFATGVYIISLTGADGIIKVCRFVKL